MFEVFKTGGPFMFPLTLIALVLVPITIRLVWKLSSNTLSTGRRGEIALQALPFWGAVSILIGLLGQAAGLYRALGIVAARGVASPRAIYIGLRESLVTTIFGFTICVLALLAWGVLRTWHSWRMKSPTAAAELPEGVPRP